MKLKHVVIVVVVGVCIIGLGYVEISKADYSTLKAQKVSNKADYSTLKVQEVSNWSHYSNSKYQFALAYPSNIITNENFKRGYFVGSNWSVADHGAARPGDHNVIEIPLARLTTPAYYATVRVGVSTGKGALERCYRGEGAVAYKMQTINGVKFHLLTLTDAGMSQYLTGTSYRVIHAGRCYALEWFETGARPAVYASNAMQLKQLQRTYRTTSAHAITVAKTIIASFRFTGK